MYRNLKPASAPFWIAETGAWNCVTSEDNCLEALKAWVYEFVARGAEAVIYFRWRQSVMGEKEHPAVMVRRFEKGSAIYQACWLDDESTGHLFKHAAGLAGVEVNMNHSSSMTSIRRGNYLFCINHGRESRNNRDSGRRQSRCLFTNVR